MRRARLLYRLIGRPMAREPARTALTVCCVALGVAVTVAIELAGEASAGSFRSSMESLQGTASYEITRVGGIPDALFGKLSRLPVPLRFSARVEGFATLQSTGERTPLFGVDTFADRLFTQEMDLDSSARDGPPDSRSVWLPESVGAVVGEQVRLGVNERTEAFTVQGLLDDSAGSVIVMDIAQAQRVLGRIGRLDRIYVDTPRSSDRDWRNYLAGELPEGVLLDPAGVQTRESRKLLRSFRWNLRVLSYIALIVGAFLVYNTVSVSVVRRRPLIGTARALGMSGRMVRFGFLAEGCIFGIAGTALGLPFGRWLAVWAVEAMSQTVQSLYVSSAPAEIAIGPWTAFFAASVGIGVSVVSSWWPAQEASSVKPAEAMAHGRREYEAHAGRQSWAWRAVFCAAASVALCFVPAVGRIPYAGFAAALGLIACSTMLVPQAVAAGLRAASRPLLRLFGIAAMLGGRTLAGSLGRPAVIVAALSCATAMMVSVGIMVGSLRETLVVWIGNQLQADLYVQPEAGARGDLSATMGEDVAARIEALDAVDAVDRFRRYPIRYGGLPATLAMADMRVQRGRSSMRLLDGPEWPVVADRLVGGRSVMVSESFGSKHGVRAGSTVLLPVGNGAEPFEVVAVYADYSGEEGYVVGDRGVLMRYLPDENLTSLAIYLKPGADLESARADLVGTFEGRRLRAFRNRDLRENALVIFDRTFAITYALEAIAVLVAILGMVGALTTLVIDRRGELGMLRAIGATKRQVRRLVLAQAGLLGLAANCIGLGLGAVLSVVLVKVINKQSFGWTIQFHWPVGFLLAALTAIYAASFVAGAYPARVAASRDPTETLHEE